MVWAQATKSHGQIALKISRQPVKKSKKTAVRTARGASREKSRSAEAVARAAPSKTAAKGKKRKWVYAFGGGKAQGRASMRNLLGGKGAGLADMAHLGLPVPPGFTITTEVCDLLLRAPQCLFDGLKSQVEAGMRSEEHRKEIRRRRQSAARLRSLGCARVDAGHDGHGSQSGAQRHHRRGAVGRSGDAVRLRHLSPVHQDVWRRGVGIRAPSIFERVRRAQGSKRAYKLDTDLDAADSRSLVQLFQGARARRRRGKPFPQEPEGAAWDAIDAVFGSG